MAVETRGQLAIDETLVEDDELEAALERRQTARDDHGETRRAFEEAHAAAEAALKAKFGELEDDQVYRVGRFRIEKKITPARTVSFVTDSKERLSIGLADGEE